MVLSILASVQPIQERAKFNSISLSFRGCAIDAYVFLASRMNQKRVSINTSSSLKHETIPEEDWNFSSEEDSENEPIDCENRARSTCDGSEPGQDRRGRFVVEPTPTATSVNPSNTVEEGQSSIQSAVEASAEVNGEIKKGRFCVNAAPTPTNSNSPNGGGSPKGILMDLNGGAIPSTSLPLEIDEEGRKSRFEILPNIPENNTTSTLAASNIRHHVSSAKNSFDHLPKDSLSTATAIEANSNDQPHIHRPFPNRKPTHSTSLAGINHYPLVM